MTVYVPKTSQFNHQKRVLDETWDRPGYAWWWEQGTGKSKEFIDNGGVLYCEGLIGGMFLLAPNGLHRNFINRELPKHLPDEMLAEAKTLFWHTQRSKTKAWKNVAIDFIKHHGLKVLGMSYDGIMTEEGRALAKEFLTSCRCLYGADESPRIKEMKAARTKRVLASAPYAPYRRIMTGTPIANAPWDIYSQIKFVDTDFWRAHGLDSPEAMKAQFGQWEKTVKRVPIGMVKRNRSLQHYYRENNVPECLQSYFKAEGDVGLQYIPKLKTNDDGRPQYKNLDQLRDIVATIRSRVLKSEAFDLPPKLYTTMEFELTPSQRTTYNQMHDLGFALMDGRQCSANLALTILLRLQQIACGYLVTDLEEGEEDPTILPISPNPRLELLEEIVEGIAHQGIIWSRFTPDITAICEMMQRMGKSFVRYDGRVDEDQREINENRFHAGDAQWFVSNQQVGGEGLTLIEAHTMIYYANSFKLIERLQSEDRPHRYGQTFPLDIIDLVARGTMEERLINNLIGKFDVASIVVGDGFREWIKPVDRLL